MLANQLVELYKSDDHSGEGLRLVGNIPNLKDPGLESSKVVLLLREVTKQRHGSSSQSAPIR